MTEHEQRANVTEIPNVFIDEHMPKAKPEHSAVYITGLRHAEEGFLSVSLKTLATALSARELDVAAAWAHWESVGLIKILDGSAENFKVEFIFPEEPEETEDKGQLEEAGKKPVRSERPSYSVDEITHVVENNEDARYLFKMAEKILGKPLTYTEMNLFLSFIDWLMLPVEVIEVLLDFCVSNNKRGKRYMETVAVDWADNDIKTVEDAESYIKLITGDYREIMKSFGLSRRDASPKEIVFMKKWLKEYNMPLDVVTEACGKTVLQIGHPKFTYADSILERWYESGVKTLEEAIASDIEFHKNKKSAPAKPVTGGRRKSRFANHLGHEWDYDKLEKLAIKYVEDSVSK